MLQVDPTKRIDGNDIMKHPWVKNFLDPKSPSRRLDSAVISKLRSYRSGTKLRQTALNIFVKMLDTR